VRFGNAAKCVAIFCLSDSADSGSESFTFMARASETVQLNHDIPTNFKLDLTAYDSSLVSGCQNKKAVFTLLIMDEKGRPICYSNTFSSE